MVLISPLSRRRGCAYNTNSSDRLWAALGQKSLIRRWQSAITQSRQRNILSREEWEGVLSLTNIESIAEHSFDHEPMSNSGKDISGDERASGEEIDPLGNQWVRVFSRVHSHLTNQVMKTRRRQLERGLSRQKVVAWFLVIGCENSGPSETQVPKGQGAIASLSIK